MTGEHGEQSTADARRPVGRRVALLLAVIALAALLVALDRRAADERARVQLAETLAELELSGEAGDYLAEAAAAVHPSALARARRANGYDPQRYLVLALEDLRATAAREDRAELARALERLRDRVVLERRGSR